MRIPPVLALLFVLAIAPSLAGQAAQARVTASATVVEAAGIDASPVRVSGGPEGFVEVSAFLEVGGRGPRIVAAVEGGAIGGTLLTPPTSSSRGGERVPVRAAVRVGAGPASPRRALTYVVSHIN